MKETIILICVKDRPTELAMLLTSLKFQTYQDFDIIILDDNSGTPLNNYHFFNCIKNRLIEENHEIIMLRSEFNLGVSKARQRIVDEVLNKGYKYFCRVDDDVVLESDFIERLIKVIEQGYDLASGVTPPMHIPTFIRNSEYLEIANRVILDNEGNFIFNGDDCGSEYTDEKLVPAHHFRSSALMKKEVLDKIKYTPTKLSNHGFREEEIFSFKALMEGFKIGVDLKAIAWHQMTPSGGERFAQSREMINHNSQILKEFTKDNKDKLNKIFLKEPKMNDLELQKENNLI